MRAAATHPPIQELRRRLDVAGPFDLGQALDFLRGFPAAGGSDQAGTRAAGRAGGEAYRAAHVLAGRALAVELWEGPEGLTVAVRGPGATEAHLDAAGDLIRRMFSLDLDGADFERCVLAVDPVMAGLQRRFPGLRPVLLPTPFEALCWAVLSQRTRMPQAARLRARLVAALGPRVALGDQQFAAFPAPEHLLALDPRLSADIGLPEIKAARLRRLAERGARGDFDARRLRTMSDPGAWLERSPGIGPWASEFVLIRGVGSPAFPRRERRLLAAVQRFYGLAEPPSPEILEELGRHWGGFGNWAAFLLRVALEADTRETAPGASRAEARGGRA